MRLSIRARLTCWYCAIVIVILTTAGLAGSIFQSRFALSRLDEDLVRTMATLDGVMRTEFGEGLSLEGAAKEASTEVVAPDRSLVLRRDDGTVLEQWGAPMALSTLPTQRLDGPSLSTIENQFRILERRFVQGEHRYSAIVGASLAPLDIQHAEMVRAMLLGAALALLAAAVGAYLIGRQALRPLTTMASQASSIDERDLSVRLDRPVVNDEIGRLASAFNDLLDRLSRALALQRTFMADASHELRTPVSVVRTATEFALSREARPASEYRDALVIIGEQASRLSRLVNAMFLLSRAEAAGVPLQREYLNLDDALAECVRAIGVLGRQRGIRVATIGDQEVGLFADAGLLSQMIANLLDNAVRHAAANGQVIAELTRTNGSAHLRIVNDGEPIASPDHQRIFERFVRIGGSAGAGLGLPIARWIAEAHGGTLTLEQSQPGRTSFVVVLPLTAVH
jgi:two-component system, OmpR family, sensor kinase